MPLDSHISLAHGNGGRLMRELIEELFVPALRNEFLDTTNDAASLPQRPNHTLVVTTDGFTVQPIEFNGGNIGSLAVHGTINDLAVSGAVPEYMTLSVFLEEGLEIAVLKRVIEACGVAARECGVYIVAGDTKILGRGECDRIYLSVTGIGFKPYGVGLSMAKIEPGDHLLVSGTVGDHGAAILLARAEFGLISTLRSDAASVFPAAQALLGVPGLRFMRDPTRGGLATVAHEIARGTVMSVQLFENKIPIHAGVRSVCELLGFDPLYLACEGRIVAVVDANTAARALAALQHLSPSAEDIGVVEAGPPRVSLSTRFGGSRMLDELEDDPLPRIC